MTKNAYELLLDEEEDIDWIARQEDGASLIYREQPTDSQWRMFMSRFYGVLPIGNQL